MSLTSMKMSKRDSKGECAIDCSDSKYPYGIRINLDNHSLDKLGISKLPEVGTEMIVVGVGVVESANERKRRKGIDRDISIQLQRLEVGPLEESTAEDAVSRAVKDA